MYGGGFSFVFLSLLVMLFFLYGYQPANCFDNEENGNEVGIDCGGRCIRICTVDVSPPTVAWVKPFRITEGMYNAVAYVENKNEEAGVADLSYIIKLFDHEGMIVERAGSTMLPPNVVSPFFEGRILTGDRVPTHATIELADNPVWVPATLNGERYMTERRELTSADKRPSLTAVLKNESLDEAKDVDIVATIFNSQGAPLTASRTKVPVFPGRASKKVTFTWQEPIATTLRSCEVPTDVVMAIDLSGSMNNDGGNPPEPITSVLEAARAFVLRLNEEDQVSLVTFATEAELNTPLTRDHKKVGTTIENLRIDPESEHGSTNTGDALHRAEEEVMSTRHNEDARTVTILLTDGLATAPGDTPEDYAREAGLKLKESNAELYTIGLGEDLNEEFLIELATDRQHYFRAPTTGELGKIYGEITEAMCEQGAAVIEVVPRPSATFAPLK
jgi:Mg-chelatase subunit ChlD